MSNRISEGFLQRIATALNDRGDWYTPARELCVSAARGFLYRTRGAAAAKAHAEDLGEELFVSFLSHVWYDDEILEALPRWLRSRGRLHDAASRICEPVYVPHEAADLHGARAYAVTEEVLSVCISDGDDVRVECDVTLTAEITCMPRREALRVASEFMSNDDFVKLLKLQVTRAALAAKYAEKENLPWHVQCERRADLRDARALLRAGMRNVKRAA